MELLLTLLLVSSEPITNGVGYGDLFEKEVITVGYGDLFTKESETGSATESR